MKAISIRQPWASLIVQNIKPIENRTWKTNYRGRVLVHAPVKQDSVDLFTEDQKLLIPKNGGLPYLSCPTSAIVGSIEIIDCVKNHPNVWAERGVWNWVLANPIEFEEPILNVKGKLSFWEYEEEISLLKIHGDPSKYGCYTESPERMSKDRRDSIMNSFEYAHCLELHSQGHCEGFILEFLKTRKVKDIANEIYGLFYYNIKKDNK